MYKKPQDIITGLLKEDINVDIKEPSITVNLKQRMLNRKIGVNIDEPTSINYKPQIGVDIVNPNEI